MLSVDVFSNAPNGQSRAEEVRKKGKRLPTLAPVAQDEEPSWQQVTVERQYGQRRPPPLRVRVDEPVRRGFW